MRINWWYNFALQLVALYLLFVQTDLAVGWALGIALPDSLIMVLVIAAIEVGCWLLLKKLKVIGKPVQSSSAGKSAA